MIVDLMVTRLCNAACPICFVDAKRQPSGSDLSYARLAAFVLNLTRIAHLRGPISVHFTGGEPLCREDFPRLLELVEAAGLPFQFVTNGTLPIHSDHVAAFSSLKKVTVSIYGGPRFHESFLDVPSAFGAASRTITELAEAGVFVDVNVTCFDANLRELPELVRLISRTGAARIKIYPILKKGRARGDRFSLDMADYARAIGDLSRTNSPEIWAYQDRMDQAVATDCRRPSSVFVDAEGTIYHCLSMAPRMPIGTIDMSAEELETCFRRREESGCSALAAGVPKCTKGLSRITHG